MSKHNGKSAEIMSDARLSKLLGRCQKTESIGIISGVLLIAAGVIYVLISRDTLIFSAILLVGLACIFLIARTAQKKKKALIDSRLGGFFASELKKAFGENHVPPTLPIDASFMKTAGLVHAPWETFEASDFYEGEHNGTHFSAANVSLRRTDTAQNVMRDATMHETHVFSGIVVRCAGDFSAFDNAILYDPTPPDEGKGKPEILPTAFDRFSVRYTDGRNADETVKARLCSFAERFEQTVGGTIVGLSVANGDLSVAVHTYHVFANISPSFDARDVEGMRRAFTYSLSLAGKAVDTLASFAEK